MNPAGSRTRPDPLLVMVTLGLVGRLLVIWSGWVEGKIISDDAFYYFRIAANLAEGNGSTFDGLAPTNGYHPLWLWLIVPIFRVFGDSLWLPVKTAITLSTLFDLGTGILLVRILGSLTERRGALVAAGFWFLSPFTVLLGLRGMEASLNAFLVMAVFWSLAKTAGRVRGPTLGSGILVGLLVGLAALARTDNLPTLGVVWFVFSLTLVRSRPEVRPGPTLVWLLAAGGSALLLVTPWLVWNYANFGSVVQVSGLAKLHYLVGGAWVPDWTTPWGIGKGVIKATSISLVEGPRFACLEEFRAPRVTVLAWGGLVAVLALPWLLAGRRMLRSLAGSTSGIVLIAAAAYLLTHTVLFGLVWMSYMNWYALGYLAVYSLILGLTLPIGGGALFGRRGGVLGLTLILAFTLFVYVRFFTGIPLGPGLEERIHGDRLRALADRYPEGVQAGGFNAGSVAYIAPRYGNITVINLDCLVNNQAYAAVREGRYPRYLLDHVEVLLEPLEGGWFLLEEAELDSLTRFYRKWPEFDLWSQRSPPDP